MGKIEDIFVAGDGSINPAPQSASRVKMGEVFQLSNERYALVCIHCLEEFQYFSEFTLHVQEHFPQWIPEKSSSDRFPEFTKIEPDADSVKEEEVINAIFQTTTAKTEADKQCNEPSDINNVKEEPDYSDDGVNDFLDFDMNDEIVKEETQFTSNATKETVSKAKRKKTTKSKSRSKKSKRIKLAPVDASNAYDELLNKFINSDEDPMDPMRFELFKTEKVDGLFPCTIKDTPEVRMMATLSLHSYKYEKDGKDFLCPVCKTPFPNPASVRRHLFTHIKEAVFLCGFCPEKFRAIRYLRGHLKLKHKNESRSFECFMCHKKFEHNQFRALKDHIQMHQIDSLNCILCNKKFKEYRYFQLHMMNIHPNGIDLNNGNQHPEPIDYYEKPVITTFECYLCHKDFRERRLLRSHMKLHVQQPKLCLMCGIFCSSATSLNRHMKLHTSDETKPHVCTICGKSFKIRQYLLRHNRKDHQLWADNTPPVCQICGAFFNKKSLLHEHMKTHPYEDTREFFCTICNHAAKNAYNLKRHMLTHSSDRSFECPLCQKTFHPRYAKDHMKSHTEARNHKCPDCGKKFKRKYALKQHMFQHGGAPEHKCDICGRAFARTDKLLRHRRRHGIPLNYHCKICRKGFISQKSYLLHESSHMKSVPSTSGDAE